MSKHTMDIGEIEEFIADPSGYPTEAGANINRPDCPAFIFRDERRTMDPDTAWTRDLALDFEEWVAKRNHEEALDKRLEEKAIMRRIPIVASTQLKTRITDPNPDLPRKTPAPPKPEELKRANYLTRKAVDPVVFTHHMQDDFQSPTPQDVIDYLERQESRELCNWLIAWHKRKAPTNDNWRKLVTPLADKLSDPVLGPTAKTILQTLAKSLPFAPGPIQGTTFINPDGSKYSTAGTDPGSAKASYLRRHKVDSGLVSVDRVQYEGQRGSRYVVGQRRSSEETPSSYYDPNPTWADERNKEGYMPNNAACLVKIPASKVMPSGSYRLTVREFERALIAGADIIEDECESTALELEAEYLPDARVLMIETGYGKSQRDQMALSHEEEYLYGVFGRFAKDADDSFWKDAQELILLGEQERDTLAAHFKGEKGLPSEHLIELLRFIAWDDKTNQADREAYLPFALTIFAKEDEAEWTPHTIERYSTAVAHFDDDEDAWSIPTGPNGACRRGSFCKWS